MTEQINVSDYNGIVLSEEMFIKGIPEAVYTAVEHPKILLIWPHGNETLGPRVGHHIYTKHPNLVPHIDYICGNPIAASRPGGAVRHTGRDLNRSFNLNENNVEYEDQRARAILNRIEEISYDFVLDLHTTTTGNHSFFLANRRNEAVDTIIAASLLSKIVLMPDSIAKASLIGQVQNSVSIEYTRDISVVSGVDDTITLIKGIVAGESQVSAKEREFYYVDRLIPKTEDPGLDVRNFKLCKDGYYPVLFGANSYRSDIEVSYLGFAALSKETVFL